MQTKTGVYIFNNAASANSYVSSDKVPLSEVIAELLEHSGNEQQVAEHATGGSPSLHSQPEGHLHNSLMHVGPAAINNHVLMESLLMTIKIFI